MRRKSLRLAWFETQGFRVRKTARLDPPLQRTSDIRLQSFSVAYDYPVAFTADAFDPDNRCLIDVLTRREPDKRHRIAVFIDDGVTSAMPDLAARVANYAAVHAQHIELIDAPRGRRWRDMQE